MPSDRPETTDEPLSREWMIDHFGEPYPAEVIGILFDRSTDGTLMSEIRAQVRQLGERRRQEREAATHAE